MVRVRVCDDAGSAAASAAARIAARLRDGVRRRGAVSLALSGGSTAPPMIDALLAAPAIDWRAVTVYQVDERVAPDGHRARNAGQLAGLTAVTTVHPMPVTAADHDVAAAGYAALLPDRLDIVHLGLGGDGHTASWPPGRDGVRDSRRDVVPVAEFSGWPRLTLTRRAVNRARCRVILAVGDAKRPVVERWFGGDPDLPVAAVRRSGTWVYLDPAAAPAERQ